MRYYGVFLYSCLLCLIITVCDYCDSSYTLATEDNTRNVPIASNDIAQQQTDHKKKNNVGKTHSTSIENYFNKYPISF
jgi:hypothetical protein